MAIVTMDNLVSGITSAQNLPFYKASLTAKGGGYYHSLWTATGTPGAGATPQSGSGATCTSATTGALSFVNPSSPSLSYIARALAGTFYVGSLIVYDRLVATSGLSGTSTSAQTINSVALPRYTSGTGVQAFIEWYTATGSLQYNLTMNYTNDSGATAQTSPAVAFQTSPVAGQMQLIPLNGKDGIRVAESVTLSGNTGTGGNFGITLMRKLLTIPLPLASSSVALDAFASGLPKVEDNACLAFMVWCSTTATGPIHGELSLAQG